MVTVRAVRILLECILVLTYFNVMCEQHHRNSVNPFINGEKNGVKNVMCKPGLTCSNQGSHIFGLTKFHDISRFFSKVPGIFSLFSKYEFQVVLNF